MAERVSDADYTTYGTLKVEQPAERPDVFDVLVAGGGPAGTAAAVRAKELGLSCLVIDYDDLLKRIRDYPKEKLIKPGYGGGDKLPFPPGGEMLTALHFDDIDKDDMVREWRRRYKEFNLHARIGSELTGLERSGDAWEVKTWNHRSGQEMRYRARHVIVAIGAGVPRRFDIPGNTDGIAFRLDDAKAYVGAPALVIGGGTSAAEAVIAISGAKAEAGDTTMVYWSYRGDRLPKVSKALSEVFFDAYTGNGNIEYVKFSEPVAVVTGPDKVDYLSLRIDRKVIEGRPPETVHLEFPKNRVVACIGEDLPVRLLQGIGMKIPMVNNRPLMLVNKEGEVSLTGVFLAGDARGPKFLQCTDFEDSTTYEQVTQKRNIKAAMWDAVLAVEVIATRLGKQGAQMAMAVAPKAEERAPAPPPVVPPAPSEAAAARQPASGAQIVGLLDNDTVEETYPLTKDKTVLGRAETTGAGFSLDIAFPDDVYMANRHAVISAGDGQFTLEDHSGGAGVWLRAQGVNGRLLAEGDLAWVGAQILMAAKVDGGWAVAHYDRDGNFRASHPVGDRGLFVGRATEVPLDATDTSLSRRHAQFRIEGGVLKVFDLGSRNGTYVRLSAPVTLANSDEFRIGSKRFRFESFAPVAKLTATDVVVDTPPAPAPPPAAPAASAPAAAPAQVGQGFAIAIEHAEHPASFGAPAGKDVLHAYFDYLKARFPDCKVSSKGEPQEHMDEPLGWECKVGLCGLCAVEIVEGADNLAPPDPGSPEMNTIENKAFLDPDPKKYRLTCLAKVKGPVRLKLPE